MEYQQPKIGYELILLTLTPLLKKDSDPTTWSNSTTASKVAIKLPAT